MENIEEKPASLINGNPIIQVNPTISSFKDFMDNANSSIEVKEVILIDKKEKNNQKASSLFDNQPVKQIFEDQKFWDDKVSATSTLTPDTDQDIDDFFSQIDDLLYKRPNATTINLGDEIAFQHLGLHQLLTELYPQVFNTEESEVITHLDESFKIGECEICLDITNIFNRSCCQISLCLKCNESYVKEQISLGRIFMECCNACCTVPMSLTEIQSLVDTTVHKQFLQMIALANQDQSSKTCPHCSHPTKNTSRTKKIVCLLCGQTWCFSCHVPWHQGVSCKQYRKGDKLLKLWAKRRDSSGTKNAQRCPTCKVYIQRTTGCDDMRCIRCNTVFCYKCGEKLRKLKFFGDHYSRFSIFGCKHRFLADRPLQRKLIRGSIFCSKVLLASLLGTVLVCTGGVVLGLGLAFSPIYGVLKLYMRLRYGPPPAPRPDVVRSLKSFGNKPVLILD